jgi:hypothetical protein
MGGVISTTRFAKNKGDYEEREDALLCSDGGDFARGHGFDRLQ